MKINWAEPYLGEEEEEAVREVIQSTWIGGNGPRVREFEMKFAERVGAKYAIATNSGTSALLASLLALKEQMGPLRVTVPSFTFIATVNTAFGVANEISFVDARRDTWNIDPDKVKWGNIVIPVDVGGLPCDYDALKETEKVILEDAAEAVGAIYKGRKVGSIADITIFSFHSAKILSVGEGGMVTTNNRELYEVVRDIVNLGYSREKRAWEYEHSRIGFNFRMPELQAAIGLVQLEKLDAFLKKRKKIAKIYREELHLGF